MFAEDLLADRVILVTGGGSGLGASMARAFHGLGATVVIVGRNAARLEETRAALGERAHAFSVDVRDAAAVDEVIASVVARLGSIDVLVNNAAGNFLAATEDLSANAFDAVVRTVLHGTFHCTLSAARHMIARGNGTILNILATYAWTGSAFVVPSAAAKAGVLALTRSLAVEWAAYGIRVNAIAPGPFPTEGAWSRLMPASIEEEALRRVPLGRFGRHEELTNLAVFLVSDASPYITGEVVTIDGGQWLATGGQFSGLRAMPRDELKAMLRRLRER